MLKLCSRLLIALVLVGALGAAAGSAQADPVRLGQYPSDPIGKGALRPGATPNAGEPDVSNNSPPPRMSMTSGVRASEPVIGSDARRLVSLAEALRWTWVIWLARYLNSTP